MSCLAKKERFLFPKMSVNEVSVSRSFSTDETDKTYTLVW